MSTDASTLPTVSPSTAILTLVGSIPSLSSPYPETVNSVPKVIVSGGDSIQAPPSQTFGSSAGDTGAGVEGVGAGVEVFAGAGSDALLVPIFTCMVL